MEHVDAVAVLRFNNRPDGTMDALTGAALEHAIEALEADPDVRAVVLTGGASGMFIRHYDVEELAETGRHLAERQLRFSVDRPVRETALHRALHRMVRSAKPYLAALNGTAMGGGFEVALAADLRIAQSGPYRIGLPEINLGILPGAGGTQHLTRLVGPARALDIILFGRTFTPEEALQAGLVNECVENALSRALVLARDLAERPARAVAHIKCLVRGFAGEPLDNGLAAERTLFCDLLMQREGIARMETMLSGTRDILDVR
jgi:enoyl-CoA hydratase